MYSAIVFDVNETLLDLRAMEPAFERYFGSGDLRKEWFNEVLKLAFATTVLGRYYDFGVVGRAALGILEKRHNKSCTERQRNSILSLMRELPAHADVSQALELLKEQGFRLVALTNSTASTAEAQLTHAGIRHLFQQVFSVDTVRRLKPAPEPYRMVAAQLGADPKSLLMVAAHSWDIAGAIHAGWNGAFVARPGQVLDALTPKPAFMAQDLSDLARMIIRKGSPRREVRVKRAK
ncbi:MAG TPA: haloacid dehalogenase type II [Chloroflexota bacterium]